MTDGRETGAGVCERAADISIFHRYSSKACSISFYRRRKMRIMKTIETHDDIVPCKQYWYVQQYGPPAEPGFD